MISTSCRMLAATLMVAGLAACDGSGAEATEDVDAAVAERARGAAVGMWGDQDGWSAVQVVRRVSPDADAGEPTTLL